MATYSVHNRDAAAPEAAIFVREGFSSGAFLFSVLWALWHRMWLVAAVLLAITVVVTMAGSYLGLGDALTAAISFAVNLIFGFEARDLQARALAATGYREIGLCHGRNLDEAEIHFYHGLCSAPAAVAAPVNRQPSPSPYMPDTLGIFGNV